MIWDTLFLSPLMTIKGGGDFVHFYFEGTYTIQYLSRRRNEYFYYQCVYLRLYERKPDIHNVLVRCYCIDTVEKYCLKYFVEPIKLNMIIWSIFLNRSIYFNYLKIHITKKTTQVSLNKFIYNDEIRQI